MVLVGGRSVLWHVMKILSHHDVSKFVICTRCRDEYVNSYFSNGDGNVATWSPQDRFCEGRWLGTDVSNGAFVPEHACLAATFRLPLRRSAQSPAERYTVLNRLLLPDLSGPVWLEVFPYDNQVGEPLVSPRPNAQGEFVSPSLAGMDPPINTIHV